MGIVSEIINGGSAIASLFIDKSKDYHLIDIWGNYETFLKELNLPRTNLNAYIWTCETKSDTINYESEWKNKGYHLILIGRIGHIKYFKRFIKNFIEIFKYKKDLNFFARLYLAYKETKIHVRRAIWRLELDEFVKKIETGKEFIKDLFESEKIDRLYLYLYIEPKC